MEGIRGYLWKSGNEKQVFFGYHLHLLITMSGLILNREESFIICWEGFREPIKILYLSLKLLDDYWEILDKFSGGERV